MKYIIRLFLAVAAISLAAVAQAGPLAPDAAVAEALAANPGAAMWQSRAEAAGYLPSQAGSLPDPRLSVGVEALPLESMSLREEGMTQLRLAYSQELPYPGKRRLMARDAELEAQAASAEAQEFRLMLAREVRMTWWGLFSLDRALDVVRYAQDLMRQSGVIAQGKYKVGMGGQQEVLSVQLELSRLLAREVDIRGRRATLAVRMNSLLGRPAAEPVILSETVVQPMPALLPLEQLQARAQARPLLQSWEHRIEAARSRRELARLDRYPDFMVGAAYGRREAFPDLVSFEVSVNLPLFAGSKQARAIDQRTSELLERQFSLQDQRLQVADEIGQAQVQYEQAREQIRLLTGGILPQARQALDAMLAGFQANTVDALALIQAEVMLNDYEMQHWEAYAQAHQALARLQAAIGEERIHE